MRAVVAACHDLDGGKIAVQELDLLADRAEMPVATGRRTWHAGGCAGLASREVAPRGRAAMAMAMAMASAGNLHVALDGSIDNRKELSVILEGGGEARPRSDASLLLMAYQKWGADCVERLLGEFAFVLWDEGARRLVAARDPFGLRELFYRRSGSLLLIASQTGQLVDRSRLSLGDIDEGYLANFLSADVSISPQTPYRSVRRLPAAHILIAESNSVSTHRYWDLKEDAGTDSRGAEEHEERFRQLFEEAVSASLNTPGRVWAELSGGFDSTSIASAARRLPDLPEDFSTITLGWPETPASDETEWADLVRADLGLPGHNLACDDAFFEDAEKSARLRNEPHFGIMCYPMHRKESDFLVASGVDVLISGARAEAVTLDAFAPIHLSDLLRRGRLGELAHQLRAWNKATNEPLLNLFYWSCLKPLVQPLNLDQSAEERLELPAWVDERFAQRMDLTRKARSALMPRRFRSAADQYQYELLGRSEQMTHRGCVEWTVEVRHPFLYRPLVEHCFAIPWRIKHRPGEHKTLLRRALRGVLPEVMRKRQGWKGPTAAAFKALVRRWESIRRLGEEPVLAELGVLDVGEWRRALELARHGSCKNFAGLTSVMALEVWLRTALGESGLAAETRKAA